MRCATCSSPKQRLKPFSNTDTTENIQTAALSISATLPEVVPMATSTVDLASDEIAVTERTETLDDERENDRLIRTTWLKDNPSRRTASFCCRQRSSMTASLTPQPRQSLRTPSRRSYFRSGSAETSSTSIVIGQVRNIVRARRESCTTLEGGVHNGFHLLEHRSFMSARVRINVSGHLFEAPTWLLDRHPDTLLGNPDRRSAFYDRNRDELFLDRHRPSFEAVFSYYQLGGRLRRPHHVPDDIFLAEIEFYELEKEVVDEYKMSEGYTVDEMRLPTNEIMKIIWMHFEYPETSRSAYLIAVISVIMTLVSIVLFCIETLPLFSKSHCVGNEAPNFLDPFFVIETVCTAWFTIEVIVRFASCPSKILYWRDFKNIVDVTAIVPYYVTFINVVSTMSCASAKSSASLAFLRVIRLVRVFKLTKHSVGLQVLIMTFKASLEGLSLFLVALVVCLLVYSSAIYYAELGQPGSQIHSIPDGFWWAIITMTTVGYGDKVPVGPWGRLIGAACAITGVLTLAIPVPIITGHFNRFYSHKTGRGRHV